MFPWMMAFFAGFNTADLLFMPKLDAVFSLYTKFLLAMAVVFQMPTLVFFLAKMKLITARFLVSQFKYAVLLIFIISAVITPTGDPVTQTVFAAPMVGLYVLGIAIAWVVGPKKGETV
jgi:sec-independent protein translocase protein TatC